ncbi:hypothetical protein RND71_019526 [Anisodus tanguticus]|uniref:Uncharacterized protein n=1 Tax=Anisodus tanguticus TaxID=243964 RepID=A0AAE1S0D1_9SOLA|nr:hypothetical protein RND71_019526 [Anisodus tanguticus]
MCASRGSTGLLSDSGPWGRVVSPCDDDEGGALEDERREWTSVEPKFPPMAVETPINGRQEEPNTGQVPSPERGRQKQHFEELSSYRESPG